MRLKKAFYRFRVFHFSHIGLALLLLTFAYFERNHLTFFTIMENLASASEIKLFNLLVICAYVFLFQKTLSGGTAIGSLRIASAVVLRCL